MSKEYTIAVIPGDGIGEEVVNEGIKSLNALSDIFGFKLKLETYPWSADHFLETGDAHPDRMYDEYRQMDGIYLGALGDPRVETGFMERSIIGGIRFNLDLFVNLRPIKLYAEHLCPLKEKGPEHIDSLIVRENTEDAYTGLGGIFQKDTENEVAVATMLYTRKGVERVIRYTFEECKKRGRKRVTLVDKANAIRPQDIWTRIFNKVSEEYPDIETDHMYIDAACMWMVKNPEWFDMAVMPNIFGDILTDLGAMIQGGLGIAASGNLHPGKTSMFEPIHGSAPKYKGKNVANPLAAINAALMMLEYLGETEAANTGEKAIADLLGSGRIKSLGAGEHACTEIGDMVVAEVRKISG